MAGSGHQWVTGLGDVYLGEEKEGKGCQEVLLTTSSRRPPIHTRLLFTHRVRILMEGRIGPDGLFLVVNELTGHLLSTASIPGTSPSVDSEEEEDMTSYKWTCQRFLTAELGQSLTLPSSMSWGLVILFADGPKPGVSGTLRALG